MKGKRRGMAGGVSMADGPRPPEGQRARARRSRGRGERLGRLNRPGWQVAAPGSRWQDPTRARYSPAPAPARYPPPEAATRHPKFTPRYSGRQLGPFRVPSLGCRYGCGFRYGFQVRDLHPNLKTRTRVPTAETRDLKMPPLSLRASGQLMASARHPPPGADTRHPKRPLYSILHT